LPISKKKSGSWAETRMPVGPAGLEPATKPL
jgi:hypothetical protein